MARFVIVALCLVLLAAGCGKEAQEAKLEEEIEKATGKDAEVDISKEGMKIEGETEEGKYEMTAGDEAKIPKDFPDDVFIYRPSEVTMSMKVPEGHSVTLVTKDDKDKVLEAYKKEMEGKGWSEEGSMHMNDTSMLTYKKGPRMATVNMAPTKGTVQIVISVGEN